jgi:hypothetical protein
MTNYCLHYLQGRGDNRKGIGQGELVDSALYYIHNLDALFTIKKKIKSVKRKNINELFVLID